MITRNTLAAIALATTCLAPLTASLAASADDFSLTPDFALAPASVFSDNTGNAAPAAPGTVFHGDVAIGLMGVMGQNADQAGRYNGLNTTGMNMVGQFDLRGGSAWNSGGTRYYEFSGDNLVFQTGNRLGSEIGSDSAWASSTNNTLANEGSLSFKVGDQGKWEIGGFYNAITYTGNVIDSLYTVNGNHATLNNNLAAWGGATPTKAGSPTTFTIPTLTATGAMQPFQTGTRRDQVGANGKYIYGDWTFTLAVSHEHKSGSMEESLDGEFGGTAFALPIDYDTDRLDATAAYATRLWQGSLQYTYSHFADNNLFVSLPYPASNTKIPYQESAAYSTPPSNQAQYLTLMLASNNILPKTRVNLNARIGLEQQDDTFAPASADPNLAGVPNVNNLGLDGVSPDINATVYQVKVSAASNPFPNTDTNVYYGIDGRSVSLNQYGVYGEGNGMDASAAGTTPYAFVVPQDWLKQNAGADVGYRLIPETDTRLTAGYRLDDTERSNAQVGHSSTSTASVGLSSRIGDQLNGKISFDYANRSGALSYLTPWYNLDGTGASPTYSGAYYQAPMTSETVTVRGDYSPRDNLSGDVFISFKNEDYNYPAASNYTSPSGSTTIAPLTGVGTGIKQDYALTVGPDITYRPTKQVNIDLYYTYELLFYNNLGNGACATSNTGACAGSAGYFQNKDTSGTHTVGFNGEWQVNDKLKLRGSYSFSYGSVMFAQFDGVFVPNPTASYQNVSNYPDIDSAMNNINVSATYALMPNTDLILDAGYTTYHSNNFNDTANAIQGAGTTAVSILTPGYSSPDYSIATLMAGVKFRF
jgi:hypothetical protein